MSVTDITPPTIDTTPPIMDITGSPCFLEKQRVIQALTKRRDELIEG